MAMDDQNPDPGNAAIVAVGQDVVVAINGLRNTVAETFPNWVTAPANCTASGVAGQVAYSGSASTTAYLYVCITAGSTGNARWGRLTLTTTF